MELHNRIKKITPYFILFTITRTDENSIMAYVGVKFPKTWEINEKIIKTDYNVSVKPTDKGLYFVIDNEDNEIDTLFDAIDYVIAYNKEIEEKNRLLNEKAKELTKLFATESLENLRNLTFNLKTDEQGCDAALLPAVVADEVTVDDSMPEEKPAKKTTKGKKDAETNNDSLMNLAEEMVEAQ